MKILHIIPSINPSDGGTVEMVKILAAALVNEGNVSEVVCVDPPDSLWLKKSPCKVYPLGSGMWKYGYSRQLVPWLLQNASNYDCAIVHGIWQYASFAAWLASRNSGFPYFIYPHGMLDPWFKHTYPLKHLKKWLYWPWADYRVLRDARAVLFTCEAEKLLARQSFWLYKSNEVVVGCGTSAPLGDKEQRRQAFFVRFPELQSKRLLLFLGRIHYKKGCDLLIEAFASVAGVDKLLHLAIAGPDVAGWQAQLQKRAMELGIERRITWTGVLSGDLKWGAFHAADVFVLPSRQENFGMVVAEALACGIPVLATNKVNIWREIATDDAGIVSTADLAGITNLLKQWLALSPGQKQVMRDKAKLCFIHRFEIQNVAQRLLKVLETYGVKTKQT